MRLSCRISCFFLYPKELAESALLSEKSDSPSLFFSEISPSLKYSSEGGLLKKRFIDFLPSREKRAGLAEAVKVALIRDHAFFLMMEKQLPALQCLPGVSQD